MKRQHIVLIIILLLGGCAGNYMRYSEQKPDKEADLTLIPKQINDYTGIETELDAVTLEVLNATTSTQRFYRDNNGNEFDLFIAYFKSQKFGTGIHSPKHCLPGGGWKIRSHLPLQINLTENVAGEINQMYISNISESSVMLYWFETRSGLIRSEYGLKFDLFENALLFKPSDAAFVRITIVALDGDLEKATARGIKFARTIYPSVMNALPFFE